MNAFGTLANVDAVLRRRGWAAEPTPTTTAFLRLVTYVAVFGVIYGVTMGSFAGVVGQRLWSEQIWQMAYSGIKVPMLLVVTFLISLPGFYVVSSLFGLRDDFAESIRALIATQATLAIVLCSFAPLTLFWYFNFDDYSVAVLVNGGMFALASFTAQVLLRGYYQSLIHRNKKHRGMLWAWLTVYVFVGIQMAWVLRPFVGSPSSPVRFFRPDVLDNAYVIVVNLLWSALF